MSFVSEDADLSKYDQWNQSFDPNAGAGEQASEKGITRKIPIDRKQIGRFIGKKGANIRQMSLNYGVHVDVNQRSVRCSISIVGKENDVLLAEKGILENLRFFEAMDKQRADGGQGKEFWTFDQMRRSMSKDQQALRSEPVPVARPKKEDTLGNLQKQMKVVLKRKRIPNTDAKKEKRSKDRDDGEKGIDKADKKKGREPASSLLGLDNYGSDSDSNSDSC